jgi:transcriptional regulator with XRE-family HTH domain
MPIDRNVWLGRAAERFKTLRRDRGLSVAQIAKDSGISERTIYNLEAAKHMPSVEKCIALGAVLGVENLPARLLED